MELQSSGFVTVWACALGETGNQTSVFRFRKASLHREEGLGCRV